MATPEELELQRLQEQYAAEEAALLEVRNPLARISFSPIPSLLFRLRFV